MIINQIASGGGGSGPTPDPTINLAERLLLHGEDLTDSSLFENAITGTAVSSATKYKFGTKSLYFDGSSYLGINRAGLLAFDTELFTLDFWINFSTYSSSGRYCLAEYYYDDNNYWYIEILNGRLSIEFKTHATTQGGFASEVLTWSTDTWYHICLQRVSTAAGYDSVRFYRDGVRYAHDTGWGYNTIPVANSFFSSPQDYPGMKFGVFNETSRYFTGYMDEIRLCIGTNTFNEDGFTPPTTQYTDPDVLDSADATAYAMHILNNYTAYARGTKITGNAILKEVPLILNTNCNYVASDTSLANTISAEIGTLIIACFTVRTAVVSVTSGWTLLASTPEIVGTGQIGYIYYKIAESTSETITVEQTSAARIYINTINLDTDTVPTVETALSKLGTDGGTVSYVKALNRAYIILAHGYYWTTSSPYPLWETDPECYKAIQYGTGYQGRLLSLLDDEDPHSRTIISPVTPVVDDAHQISMCGIYL